MSSIGSKTSEFCRYFCLRVRALTTSHRSLSHATERGYKVLSRRFARAPRRRVTLVASLASDSDRQEAERWLNHLRFGREYAEPAIAVAERAPSVMKTLRDGRRMRDSRLYRTLDGVPDETLVYMWSSGDERVRGRIERFLDVLSKVRPDVSGEDLMAVGVPPGPRYSAILSQALDDRLDGKAVGREAELANLKRLVRKDVDSKEH